MKFLSRIIDYCNVMSKYGHHSHVTDLSRSERKELAQFCLEYCLVNIGVSKRKGIPTFSIVKGKTVGTFGQYCPVKKKVYVYYDECKTVGKFISTFIHEFTHHTQDLKNYDKILSRVGYENHPLEIEANEVAKEYKQDCLERFRKYIMSYE